MQYKIRPLRDNSTLVWVYNSGPTMFLYDDASQDAIRDASPSLLHGYYGDPAKDVDGPLLALGEQGHLVVFELYQDDEFVGELSVGQPLSQDETDGLPWSEPAWAYLNLPSGRLCVESLDSLRVGDDDPTDPGAMVSVPPGAYAVSLQCLSHDYKQDDNNLIAEYFIALERLDADGTPPAKQPFLAYPWR